MQQSNFIFAMLLIGFILFITNKGELGTYIQFLRGGGAQTPLASGTTGAGGGTSGLFGNVGDAIGSLGGLNLGSGGSVPVTSINQFQNDPTGTPGLSVFGG